MKGHGKNDQRHRQYTVATDVSGKDHAASDYKECSCIEDLPDDIRGQSARSSQPVGEPAE